MSSSLGVSRQRSRNLGGGLPWGRLESTCFFRCKIKSGHLSWFTGLSLVIWMELWLSCNNRLRQRATCHNYQHNQAACKQVLRHLAEKLSAEYHLFFILPSSSFINGRNLERSNYENFLACYEESWLSFLAGSWTRSTTSNRPISVRRLDWEVVVVSKLAFYCRDLFWSRLLWWLSSRWWWWLSSRWRPWL